MSMLTKVGRSIVQDHGYHNDTTTTSSLTTTAVAETTQPPTSSTDGNRTGIELNRVCGSQSAPGKCLTDHSACSPTKSDSVWKCRCIHGYIRKDTGCIPVPETLFVSSTVQKTIPRTTAIGSFVLDIEIRNDITALCTGSSSARIYGSGQFSASASSCDRISVSLTSNIPELTNEFSFVVLATLTLNDDVLVTDGVLVTIKISDLASPADLVVPIPDGTFAGTTIATIDRNYLFPNDELSLSDTSLLSIDSTGEISVKTNINLSQLRSQITLYYAMPVIVNRKQQGASTPTKFLTVTVVIVRGMFSSDVPENSTNGYTIASVGDLTGLNYTIVSNDMPVDAFDLSQSKLSVRNNDLLDYENGKKKYEFDIKNTIKVPMKGDMVLVTHMVLNILDRNDHPPKFSKASFDFEIDQTSLDSVIVGHVLATDIDSNTVLKYSLQGDQGHFLVDEFGIVTTQTRPKNIPFSDISGKGLYSGNFSFQIRVSDDYFSPQSAEVTVYLLQLPQYELNKKFQFSVQENTGINTNVGTVSVSGYRNYRFASPERAGKYFTIDSTSGMVRVAGQLDREDNPGEKVAFSVVGDEEAKSYCFVTVLGDLMVDITDVNDNPPIFKETSYTGSVVEEKGNEIVKLNTPIITTDKDVNSTVTFSLSNSFNKFAINSTTGVITTTAKLNRELSSTFDLQVVASDGAFSPKASVKIEVLDVNDNAPVFSSSPSKFDAKEPQNDGKLVGTVLATDADFGQNAAITYTLEQGDGLFSIDHENGEISLSGQLDRETQANHTITITAIDGGDPYKTSIHSVVVTVTDINDNSPVFEEDSLSQDVDENTICTSNSIMTVLATDPDEGENGRVSFKIVDNNSRFSITDVGKVYCKSGTTLDYETVKTYSFEVVAEDNASTNKLSSTATVHINVQDVNDNAPVIQSISDIVLRSSEFSGKPLVVIEATDKDSGNNAKLSHSYTSSLSLEIDGNGIVKGTAQPSNGKYPVTIKVKDGGVPPKESVISFNIDVVGDATSGVKFLKGEIALDITENNAENAQVGSVSMSSYVENSLNVKYQFVRVTNYFIIDSENGYIRAKVKLDREDQVKHLLVVKAYNPNNAAVNHDLALVNITIKDVNDNPPIFIEHVGDVYRLSVSERETRGYQLKTIKATDPDEGANAKVEYSIKHASGSHCSRNYAIDKDSGIITLVNQQNYELQTLCKFNIEATDSNYKATAAVDVNILDYNDNRPIFHDVGTVDVREDVKLTESVQVPGYVTDEDSRLNGDVVFSIDNTDVCPFEAEKHVILDSKFRIKLLIKKALDYETTQLYNCVLIASDRGNPVLNATKSLSVKVVDVNDNDPKIDENSIEDPIKIPRDVDVGFVVLNNINASDEDSGENKKITFHIAHNQYFLVHPDTGMITVREKLLGLQKESVTITVTARDSGSPPRQSSIAININIEDDNTRPTFTVSTATVSLDEGRWISGAIYTASATDFVNQKIVTCNCSYRLTKSSDVFEIESDTGIIKLKTDKYLDREGPSGPEITLSVIGRDSDEANPKDSNPFSLKIMIKDINDQAPFFPQNISSAIRAIPQMTPINTLVGTIYAVDKDVGQNAITRYQLTTVSYSPSGRISDTNSSVFMSHVLTINGSSGQITTNGSLDLKKTNDFYLVVIARAFDAMDSSKESVTTFAVRVLYDDPNKYTPVFSKDTYRLSIDRKQRETEAVVTVSATDDDNLAPNNKIKYAIVRGNVRDIFEINADSGVITIGYLIDGSIEANIITLTIEATDMGINPRKSTCRVEISLTGEINKLIPEVDALKERQIIQADRDMFMIVMIVFIVLMCFFIILSIVYIYKFKSTQRKIPEERPRASQLYSGLDEDSRSKDFSSIYTSPSTAGSAVNVSMKPVTSFNRGFTPETNAAYVSETSSADDYLRLTQQNRLSSANPPQLPQRNGEADTTLTNFQEGSQQNLNGDWN